MDAENIFHHIFGKRSLDGELAQFIAEVIHLDIESFSTFFHPCYILVDIRRIDNEEEIIFATLVNKKVVNGASVRVQHHAVENLAVRGSGNIIGENVVHIFFGFRSGNKHLAHVAYVKHSASCADCIVLLCNAGVLDRHIKSGKRAHLCPKCHML